MLGYFPTVSILVAAATVAAVAGGAIAGSLGVVLWIAGSVACIPPLLAEMPRRGSSGPVA